MAEEQVSIWDLIKPIPRQVDFLKTATRRLRHKETGKILRKRYVLYGGARGPGKSYIARWGLVYRLVKWFAETGIRDIRVGLFCEDYPTLQDRQIAKIKSEFPDWLGTLKTTKAEGQAFYLHEHFGGGAILLRNLEKPQKYIGAEFAGIAVDELTLHNIDTFNILRGSLRWPGIDDTFFWGLTNPLGPGLVWVRELWIEGVFPKELESLSDQFAFVQALPSDNPHLAPSYWEELNAQKEHLRKAWVEGDWYSVGGVVFDEWRHDFHVIEGFKAPSNWRFFGGLDFGYRAFGWFGLFACGPDGDVVCLKEFPFKEMQARHAGAAVGELVKAYPVEYIASDQAMWAQVGIGPTVAEEFQAGLNEIYGIGRGPVLLEASHGPGSRIARVNITHRYLKWTRSEDGEVKPWNRPLLRVDSSCKYLIKTLPVLPYDPKKQEDVDTTAEDHAYDGLSYFLMSRPPLAPDMDYRAPGTHPGLDSRGRRQKTPDYIQAWLDREKGPPKDVRPSMHTPKDKMVPL